MSRRAPSHGGVSRRRWFQQDVHEVRALGGRILSGIADGSPRPHIAGLALAVALGALAVTLDATGRGEFFDRVVEAAHASARAWEDALGATRTIH